MVSVNMSIHTVLGLVGPHTISTTERLAMVAMFVLHVSLDVGIVFDNFATHFAFKSSIHAPHKRLYNGEEDLLKKVN